MSLERDIIHKIGLKYGLSDEEVVELVRLSYKYVVTIIESGDRKKVEFKNVKMPGLGTFYVSDKFKNYYKKDGKEY